MGVAASLEKAEEPSPDSMGVAPPCPARNPTQPPNVIYYFCFLLCTGLVLTMVKC